MTILWFSAAGVLAQNSSALPATPTINDLPQLAQHGEFGQVLALLRHDPNGSHDPRAVSLIEHLERYRSHSDDQSAERHEQYQQALEEMVSHIKIGKLEDAMVSAIDAHGLADDPVAMIKLPHVVKLTRITEEKARQAEWTGDWPEALNLYRMLDLLYDDFATYRDKVKLAARHVRVLRMYAPNHLYLLYAARARRLGKDEPPKPSIDEQGWKEELEGVDISMLSQALARTIRRHVDTPGYLPLLISAVENLQILANTQGLGATFPSMDEKLRLARFRTDLKQIQDRLKKARNEKSFDFLKATDYLDRVMTINAKSVKLPEKVVVAELTSGAISALDDFSSVIWPSEKKNFTRNTRGKFSGVGISIAIRDDRLMVVSPLEDTPAHHAGLHAGDVIVTVDGRDASSWGLDRAVKEITGPEGSHVKIGVERTGEHEVREFDLVRAEIVIRSVRGWKRKPEGGWDYYVDPANRIGYIRLSQFIPQTADDLDHAINQMENEHGLDALILDLRFNPGGLLSSAVDVSDRFILSGPIVSTVGPDGEQSRPFSARPDHTHRPFPMVVLINQGSASASEIVAGALQDYDRAIIVGSRSFGKGSVQDLFHLDRGEAYLKLTTQYYMLPKGRIIHRKPDATRWGIEPDLSVRMTTQQVADAIEFRQQGDVLRNDDIIDPRNPLPLDPKPRTPEPQTSDPRTPEPQTLEPSNPDTPVAPEHVDNNPPAPPVPQDDVNPEAFDVDQLILKSMDPQLEAGVLILKTQLVAQHIALAHRD